MRINAPGFPMVLSMKKQVPASLRLNMYFRALTHDAHVYMCVYMCAVYMHLAASSWEEE